MRGQRLKMNVFDETQKMTFVDLFGLIGGYLGLFVGISLVTVVEFIEFGMDLCLEGRRKNLKETENKEKENREMVHHE